MVTKTQKTVTSPNPDLATNPFDFESYGVRVRINGNEQALIDEAAEVARQSLLGDVQELGGGSFDHYFELIRSSGGGSYRMEQNGEYLSWGRSRRKFLKFFDTIIRVTIGEHAVDRVFLHAGAVVWKGKAILMPANSFQGKSTLVAELVRQGATYFSDDFAVLDENGLVYPFARNVSLRTDKYIPYELNISDLDGNVGTGPAPVGMVLLTSYRSGSVWRPKILSAGTGIMKIMPFALSLNSRPEFSLKVLHNIATHAIIASGSRGSAELFARTLLNFVDKHVD